MGRRDGDSVVFYLRHAKGTCGPRTRDALIEPPETRSSRRQRPTPFPPHHAPPSRARPARPTHPSFTPTRLALPRLLHDRRVTVPSTSPPPRALVGARAVFGSRLHAPLPRHHLRGCPAPLEDRRGSPGSGATAGLRTARCRAVATKSRPFRSGELLSAPLDPLHLPWYHPVITRSLTRPRPGCFGNDDLVKSRGRRPCVRPVPPRLVAGSAVGRSPRPLSVPDR